MKSKLASGEEKSTYDDFVYVTQGHFSFPLTNSCGGAGGVGYIRHQRVLLRGLKQEKPKTGLAGCGEQESWAII